MISHEKLKKFLLYEDQNIRKDVGRYFYNGHIQDPEILPLTIQSCQRYGFKESVPLLFYAGRQNVDDSCAAELLDVLSETDDENVQMHLSVLLANASIPFLNKHLEQMQTQGDLRVWPMARNRLAFQGFSAERLWQELNDYSEKCKGQKIQISYSDPLIELLALYDYPNADQICLLLEEKRVVGQWLELFLIQLAAARKIEQAIPIINTKLSEDDLNLTDICTKAMSEISTETVIQTIKQGYVSGNWGYQLSASGILGDIKLPQSEQAIIELLENHKETLPHDIYCHLCFGLCDLFSNKAFHYGKEIMDDIEVIQTDSMRQRLLTLSHILGTPLSQETQENWKKEIATESRRIREHRREHNPELFRLGELLRRRFGTGVNLDSQDYLPSNENDNPSPIIPKSMAAKVGRNEPCRCGSGKKYKKCCGR